MDGVIFPLQTVYQHLPNNIRDSFNIILQKLYLSYDLALSFLTFLPTPHFQPCFVRNLIRIKVIRSYAHAQNHRWVKYKVSIKNNNYESIKSALKIKK